MYTPEQRQYIKTIAKQELSRRFYSDYCEYSHEGRWIAARHLRYLCKTVQEFIETDTGHAYDILVLQCPPQHGKSMTVTETLPSWYMGKYPEKRLILASYNDETAERFTRRNKEKIRLCGKVLFDIEINKNVDRSNEFELVGKQGRMISRGIMGGITSNPANCFPKGITVDTEIGKIEISELVTMLNKPRVLSYNHTCGKIELREIVATRKGKASEFITIKTSQGNKIKSTPEHRYYEPERGYKQATLFAEGDCLYTIKGLPDMRGQKRQTQQGMPSVFSKTKGCKDNNGMRLLRERIRKTIIQIQKRKRISLLLTRMYVPSLHRAVCAKMSRVWGVCKKWENVLLKKMCELSKASQIRKKELPSMRQGISAIIKQDTVLLKGLRQQCSFRANERDEQFSLQGWDKLFKMVYGNEKGNPRKRLFKMFMLWAGRRSDGKNKPANTPYRRRPDKQYGGEFNNNVRNLSYKTPQVEKDSVCESCTTSEKTQYVYDIQVEGNSNFFANGILVHNCILIDDPIKNRQEADSDTFRDRVWEEWQNSIKTRLAANAKVIVIMTRWHEDDLAGRILANENNVRLVNLPCEAEPGDVLGRKAGEALFPEIGKGNEWLKEFKSGYQTAEGSRAWLALFQGRPTAIEGNILKVEWWKYYETAPEMLNWLISVDAAFKDKETSDFTCIQGWGKRNSDMYLLDLVNEHLDFPATIEKIKRMKLRFPRAVILVEDKANGSAIIQVLKRTIPGVIAVNPEGGKVARVNAVSPAIESGNVWLPSKASWLSAFIDQCTSFPNGKKDDMVDTMSQALNRFMYYSAGVKEERIVDRFLVRHAEDDYTDLLGGEVTDSYIDYVG